MQFQRYEGNPIIPRMPGTFHSVFAANPDVLLFRGRYHMYFRGQGDERHDQIGVAYAGPQAFDGVHWQVYPGSPVIRVPERRSDFDSAHVLDPAAIVFNGRVYLYYTAHSLDPDVPSSTGLAVSKDGTRFEKVSAVQGAPGIGPEAVVRDGRVWLFTSRRGAGGHFEIGCAVSDDGVRFRDVPRRIVLSPSGQDSAFDRFSVTTVRLWLEDGWYYMTYAGCDRYADYPGAIGLARSRDLVEWERYPGNPIFARGEPGTWDEGALWFATVEKIGGTYWLWYEGWGTGLGLATPGAREASRSARDDDYGGGGKAFSQIGLATWRGAMPEW